MPTAPPDSSGPYVFVFGEPVLRKIAQPVDTSLVATIQGQANAIAGAIYGGGALSAPQAGLSVRMFIVTNSDIIDPSFPLVTNAQAVIPNQGSSYQLFINPVLSNLSAETWTCTQEGCMSFPGYSNDDWSADSGYSQVNTTRYNTFTITYQTIERLTAAAPGTLVTKTYDYTSQSTDSCLNWMLQHEVDHLNGKLFIDFEPTSNANNLAYLASIVAGKCPASWPIEFPGAS